MRLSGRWRRNWGLIDRRRPKPLLCKRLDHRHQPSKPKSVFLLFVEVPYFKIDPLVNNAGIAQNDLFQDTPEALWRRMFAVHADGAFHTIQAVLCPSQ